jgi:hypothetical protein
MWASILELTRPDEWSAHATLAATKIFASNLDPKQSQKFYKHFLLPRVRDEIQETKKLSVHLYQALKKALYKPSAFFKGILFPLCEVCLPFVSFYRLIRRRAGHAHFEKRPSSAVLCQKSASLFYTLAPPS